MQRVGRVHVRVLRSWNGYGLSWRALYLDSFEIRLNLSEDMYT